MCVTRGAKRMRIVTVGYISYRGTMHDKLCRALWFVKRVLWVCVSNADSAYFWGALKTPRGSFKQKLNFNCFVQDVSEMTWMWDWDVCHCYRFVRQMVTGLSCDTQQQRVLDWSRESVFVLLKVAFLFLLEQMDVMYLQLSDNFLFIGHRLEQNWEIPITWINIHAIG